jgi:hypothetical protein
MNGQAPGALVAAAGLAAGYGGPLALWEVEF